MPLYRQHHIDGFASVRITKVDKNYIITSSGPLSNFGPPLKNTETLEKKVVSQLDDVNSLFNANDFQCRTQFGNGSSLERERVLVKGVPRKFTGKKEQLKDKVGVFKEVKSYFKLTCKTDIDEKSLKLNLFSLAPQLKIILLELNGKESRVLKPTAKKAAK